MATVNFILKNPNGKKETPVIMVFAFGKEHIKIQMGQKVHPKLWDKSKSMRKVPKNNDNDDITNFNNRLDSIRISILSCYNEHLVQNNALYIDRIKKDFKAIVRPTGKIFKEIPQEISKEPLTLLKAAEMQIKTLDPKSWTTKHYITTKNVLLKYQKTLPKPLSFEDINMDFYNDFLRWCKNVPYKKTKKGELLYYALNTIGSHFKEVKVFMNYANDKGWTTSKGYMHKNFKVLEETSESISLDIHKIYKIYDLDLSNNKRLDQVRDLFCIDCWTGLRYGDLHQVSPDKFIDNDKKIKLRTYKGNRNIVIPLHQMIMDIVAKYDGKLPPVPTDYEINRCLKIIGRLAGITEKFSKTTTRRGKRVSKSYFEWELITVHTARRSFATNMVLAGLPRDVVMGLTDHSTEKSFNKYIKMSREQNADRVADHPVFKGRSFLHAVNE